MFTDYKYNLVIRDDIKNTTEVTFSVYQGDYETVEYEDIDLRTKQPVTKTEQVYRRTTPISEPLEKHTATFDGILSDDELAENINKIVKDLTLAKPYAKTLIAEQRKLPTIEKAIISSSITEEI